MAMAMAECSRSVANVHHLSSVRLCNRTQPSSDRASVRFNKAACPWERDYASSTRCPVLGVQFSKATASWKRDNASLTTRGPVSGTKRSVEKLRQFFSDGSKWFNDHRLEKFDPLYLRNGVSRKSYQGVSAAALPFAPSDSELRASDAEEYGFRQIGESVPDGVTLKNIIDTLPPEVFEINPWKAWKTVAITIISYSVGILAIAKCPWYLLPLAWAWTGTAATGFFVIGHDCAHKSFAKNKLIEDIVGTLAFMPLIYPYEPWRFKHDRHHAKTNMLAEDTAWHPIMREEWATMPKPMKTLMEYGMGPLRPWASIGHWYLWHFDLKKYRASEQNRVKFSLAVVFAFMAIGWPTLIYFTGILGWVKFWLMPWLGYHFWMSTFTMVHHTAPFIPFKDSKEWNAAAAQLGGTVHCDYPSWIEVLCHDINVHIPHHISQKIPSYNLRLATDSLRRNWGKYLNEARWNWRLMKTIMTQCHLYDEYQNYAPLDEGIEESKVIGSVRKYMPNYPGQENHT